MNASLPLVPRRLLLLVLLSLSAAQAFAQTPEEEAKPYAPWIGQQGKDVMWVPTPDPLVNKMLDLAEVTPQDYVIDLGSGDGRMVIAAAKRGARAHGIEYNPDLVEFAKRNAASAGVADRATFAKADIFESDFSNATVISLFLLPSLNLKLRPTILDLKPGTRIVSNSFPMDDWKQDAEADTADCSTWCKGLLWIVPAKITGTWRTPAGDLVLTQQFQVISGTLGAKTVSGKLRGNDVTFTAGDAQFTGRVDGNRIEGRLTTAGKTEDLVATQ